MEQEIRFCTASDNTRLAYAKVGQGPPLVKVANWLGHLEYEWESPVWRPWLDAWSRGFTLYRYDQRGCGLSDLDVTDFSFNALVGDLEAMVDHAGLEKFDLYGMSQGGPVAIAYAAKHPERVNKLIVYGGYLQGSIHQNSTPKQIEDAEMDLKILKLSWGTDNPAYRQVSTTKMIPEASPEQYRWFNEWQRISTTAENAVRLQQTFNEVDVRGFAKSIQVPTLVLHSKNDAAIPFEEGRLVAANIPGARLISIDSKNHVLLSTELGWSHFWREFYDFLGVGTEFVVHEEHTLTSLHDKILLELSPREQEVIRLLAKGYQNPEIAKKLVLSEKTVRNYISNIYAKLHIKSRGEAIILARESGLVTDKT
jgi:pimeloyl-ACP methyl ester carboxylesterase/DNA-binding CsgD family transcriptional regulator